MGRESGSRLRRLQGEFPNIGWQGDTDRLKELTGDAGGRGAQQEALAILLEGDFLQPVEIAQDITPFGGDALPAEPIFEFFGEQQGELLVAGFQTDRIGLQGPGIADFGAIA